MFGLFKRKANEVNGKEYTNETLSLDSKEGRDSLYASLYFQVQEDPINKCCLHIFRDGNEHYHVANGLNSNEIAKELFIAMNRSDVIRDAVIGAYNMNFKTDKEQDDIKGTSYTIKSLNGPLDGMSCYFSKDSNQLLIGKRTYHAEYAKSLAEFLLALRDVQKPMLTVFAVSLLDKNNVLCLT